MFLESILYRIERVFYEAELKVMRRCPCLPSSGGHSSSVTSNPSLVTCLPVYLPPVTCYSSPMTAFPSGVVGATTFNCRIPMFTCAAPRRRRRRTRASASIALV